MFIMSLYKDGYSIGKLKKKKVTITQCVLYILYEANVWAV